MSLTMFDIYYISHDISRRILCIEYIFTTYLQRIYNVFTKYLQRIYKVFTKYFRYVNMLHTNCVKM